MSGDSLLESSLQILPNQLENWSLIHSTTKKIKKIVQFLDSKFKLRVCHIQYSIQCYFNQTVN